MESQSQGVEDDEEEEKEVEREPQALTKLTADITLNSASSPVSSNFSSYESLASEEAWDLSLPQGISLSPSSYLKRFKRPKHLPRSWQPEAGMNLPGENEEGGIETKNAAWREFGLHQDDEHTTDYDESQFSSMPIWSSLVSKMEIFRYLRPWRSGSKSVQDLGSPAQDHLKSGLALREWKTNEKRIRAQILGYEILYQQERFVVFKIRIDDIGHWSINNVPTWHVLRRYSDFLDLFYRLKSIFPLHKIDFPPRKWLGNRFDPVFLGKRISKLQDFANQILEEEDLRDLREVKDFFCFDHSTSIRNNSSIDFDRAIFDSFEELVNELRDQLRNRELLELTATNQKEALREREIELDLLRGEIENLKKQKDGLMRALGEDENNSNDNCLSIPIPRLGTSSLRGSRISLLSGKGNLLHN